MASSIVCSTPANVKLAIEIAEYIISGKGHSTREAGKEFELSSTQIIRYIKVLGIAAYYPSKNSPFNVQYLVSLYDKVTITLKDVAKRNHYRPQKKC